MSVLRDADALRGIAWWNRLTPPARAAWLDRAWKRTSPEYTLDSMPSAADAWEAFKMDTAGSPPKSELPENGQEVIAQAAG